MEFILIYITFPDEASAQAISQHLIQKKYVACANIFPITSAFWWKDQIDQAHEWVAIVKTLPEHWEIVQTTVEAMHRYEVPCLLRIPVTANAAYANWIKESVLPIE